MVYIVLIMARAKANTRVVAYRLDGSLFRVYPSAKAAATSRHAHPRSIDKCIRGDSLTAFNLMWRRFDFDNIPESIPPFERPTVSMSPIKVAEVDEKGNVIKVYSSIKEAGRELNVDLHSIRDVLKGKFKTANGHMFKLLNNDELSNTNNKDNKIYVTGPKGVVMLSKEGKYIKSFPSIKKAADYLHKKPQGIQQVLNGTYRTAYGYKWRYKKDKLSS